MTDLSKIGLRDWHVFGRRLITDWSRSQICYRPPPICKRCGSDVKRMCNRFITFTYLPQICYTLLDFLARIADSHRNSIRLAIASDLITDLLLSLICRIFGIQLSLQRICHTGYMVFRFVRISVCLIDLP